MKILVVAPTPFFSDRGTHIRILEEALALEKLGHEITIATYHIGKNIQNHYPTKIDVRRILRLLFWYKKLEAGPDWQKIILDLMLIRKTFFLARTKKPDIIHGHLHEGVLIGWIVQKLLFWRKIKLVADFHGSLTKEMVSHGYLKNGLNVIFRFIERFINNLGDKAVASSWEGAEEIQKFRKDKSVETVLDGINLDSFRAVSEDKSALRKEWELPEDKLIVGYAGGLIPNKGINYFLESIRLVLKKRKDVFFLIGGFPPETTEKFIRENNLKESVRLVSPLDYFRLPEFLKICDVAVDPKDSATGQASGKMLNYMAAGLPIVCFDKSNNRRYLGEGGYFSSRVSGEGIAEGILYFLENPEEREAKKKICLEKAGGYGWEKPAQKIDFIYKQLTKTNRL